MSLLGNTAELAILLKLKDEFSGPLKNAENQLGHLNTKTASVAGGMKTIGAGLATAAVKIAELGLVAGTAVAGLAINATKAASNFQAAMELIHTQAGASTQEVTDLSKAVLALAPQVGTGPDALAAGLYHIESAGLRGAKALEILKVAAEGAKVGNADLESVTNALIASVNSGIKGTTDMTQAMGVLNAIVGSGNMRMQDLTAAFTTGILSSAKAFGISIQSVGAALADMTNQGVPAIDAATRLRMTISLLGAPTDKAAKLLGSIGIKSLDLATAMRGPDGILGAVQMLKDHLDSSGLSATKQAALLSAAFGGGRSSSAILTLLGSLKQFGTIQDQVNTSTGKFGEAWAATQQDVDQKVANVRASLDTLRITLGERLLPVASRVLDEFSKVLGSPAAISAADQFGQAIAGMFSADNISKAEQFIGQIAIFAHDILPPLVAGLKVAGAVTSTAIGAFMSLPGPLQALIIGGLAVNKLSGGLVATGLKQVAQGLLAGGGGAGGAGGVVGGLLGVQKVFVVNMPPGGIGGGGLGDTAKNALGGGALAAGLTVAAGAAVGGVAIDQYLQTSNQAQGIADQTSVFVKTATLDQLKAARQAVVDGSKQVLNQSWFNPFAAAAEGGLTDSLKSLNAAIDARTTELNNAFRAGERGDITRASTISTSSATATPSALAKVFRMGERGDVLSPAYEAIMARATEKGLHPTISAIEKTFAHWGTLQAAFRAGERGDLAAIKAAADATTHAIQVKQFTVQQVTNAYNTYRQGERDALPVTVNVSVSARSNETAAATANAYGPSASRAGAQGAPTRLGGI